MKVTTENKTTSCSPALVASRTTIRMRDWISQYMLHTTKVTVWYGNNVSSKHEYNSVSSLDIDDNAKHCYLLILMTMQSIVIVLSSCPTGWVKWRQSCYSLLPEEMNWMQAEAACKRLRSNLIVPDSREENDFIFEWAV